MSFSAEVSSLFSCASSSTSNFQDRRPKSLSLLSRIIYLPPIYYSMGYFLGNGTYEVLKADTVSNLHAKSRISSGEHPLPSSFSMLLSAKNASHQPIPPQHPIQPLCFELELASTVPSQTLTCRSESQGTGRSERTFLTVSSPLSCAVQSFPLFMDQW